MITPCQISKINVHVLFSSSLTLGMEGNAQLIPQRNNYLYNNLCISGYDSFEKKKLKVKVRIPLQCACDIKSELGSFTKPLVLGAL